MRYRHLLGLALLLRLGVLPVAAQDTAAPPTPPATRFNTEVVVTPERGETARGDVPAATSVLDGAILPTLPALFLGETLSFLPGFHLERGEFHAGRPVVSARGFFGGGEAEYILLLVDGVPASDAESGLIDWSLISAASIRRIEGHRGPGASMYGDSAVGGVVQILTDRPQRGGQLTSTGGTFGTFMVDGAYGRRLSRVGVDVSGSARRTAGFTNHSDVRHYVAAAGLDGRAGALTWRWTGGGNGRRSEDPGAPLLAAARRDPRISDPLFDNDRARRTSGSTALTIQHAARTWAHHARLFVNGRQENYTRTILLVPALGDSRARRLSTLGLGGNVEGQRTFGARSPIVARFGVDVGRDAVDSTYTAVDQTGRPDGVGTQESGRRVRAGAFVSSAWRPWTRLRISAAIRGDHVADQGFGALSAVPRSHRAWSPRVGATFQLSQAGDVVLFSQVSRAFKVPTLDQLFDARPYPDFRGGTFTISNSSLVPQRATNVEAGMSGGNARLHWSALAYRMNVEDEIDFDVRTFSYANIGRSRHSGVELEAGSRLWARLQPSATYALTTVTDGERGRQLKNVPQHAFTLAANLELPLRLSTYLRYRQTRGAYLDDENTVAIQGPSSIDLRIRRPIGAHVLFMDVLNLTNDRYEEYGFTLAGFGAESVAYAYPGAPRAVRAGMTLAF